MSAFEENGFQKSIEALLAEVVDLYKSDDVPWVIGYSGGKDSTATLQLVWMALENLSPEERKKPVHVISTDTLVENPVVAQWVNNSLENIAKVAEEKKHPITPHKLVPKTNDSFWVNLIGRGYPAPRPKFRWCTERLKINPASTFLSELVKEHGEAILVLGSRKAESAARSAVMKKLEARRTRDRLSPNMNQSNSFVYTPLEEWTNDDVWLFLMQVSNPWGYNNKDLLTMYRGASADNECPLVVDTSTPSCGDSRFGCWVCTMVDEDRSMSAMIQNDQEKEWMEPLLALRNQFAPKDEEGKWDDRKLRDYRRMSGAVQLHNDRLIHGPYKEHVRHKWLRDLLTAQEHIRQTGPEHVSDFELITLPELDEIRRIWVIEKHEIEDSLPKIYLDATGREFPGRHLDDNMVFGPEEMRILSEICEGNHLHFRLVRELLAVEKRYHSMLKRAGLFKNLEKTIRRHFYDNEDDALELARHRKIVRDEAEEFSEFITDPYLHPVSPLEVSAIDQERGDK